MNEWRNEGMKEWRNESMNDINEWMNESMDGWMDEWMDERMDVWKNGWMSEKMNELSMNATRNNNPARDIVFLCCCLSLFKSDQVRTLTGPLHGINTPTPCTFFNAQTNTFVVGVEWWRQGGKCRRDGICLKVVHLQIASLDDAMFSRDSHFRYGVTHHPVSVSCGCGWSATVFL